MRLDFTTMDRRTAYFWMASTIAPRPVAWVSTVSAEGVANLAPFSFFGEVVAAHVSETIVGADGYGRTNGTDNFKPARPLAWVR